MHSIFNDCRAAYNHPLARFAAKFRGGGDLSVTPRVKMFAGLRKSRLWRYPFAELVFTMGAAPHRKGEIGCLERCWIGDCYHDFSDRFFPRRKDPSFQRGAGPFESRRNRDVR